jgi:hypothetical protein
MVDLGEKRTLGRSTKKKLLIIQSNYIPWKGYFDCINTCDEFIIYDDMQYTRRDWRNRNRIKTANGPIWLTIPVLTRGNFKQKIRDTKVADRKWAHRHWRTIRQSYAKAACFKEHEDFFADLYEQASRLDHLSEINYLFVNATCKLLGIQTTLRWSSDFQLANERSQRLVDICVATGSTDYFSGPAAKSYLDERVFEKAGITLHWFDYAGYPEYEQLHPPFEHSVSIIDLIFNVGDRACRYMKSFDGNEGTSLTHPFPK